MGAKGDGEIIGYRYHVGMQMALCVGPVNSVNKMYGNEKLAWSAGSTGGAITVAAEELFGGEEREGGFAGKIDLDFGAPAQGRNSYLISQIGSNVSAYRGVCAAILNQFYIGDNPYIKPIAFELTRTTTTSDGSTIWYSAKADINSGDMNPIHVLYEALTDVNWGMGYSTFALNDSNFRAAADVLYTEELGFSLLWNRQDTIGSFIQTILNHISGVLTVSPVDGLFSITLFRFDYDPNTLPVYNEDNTASLDSYSRKAWGETINEITVVYRDRETDLDVPVSIQDTANIQFQGSVINKTINFPSVSNETSAIKVAQRELKVISSPLAKLEISINRVGWSLNVGDTFKFSWDELGIVTQIFRVLQINTGSLDKGVIKVVATEDVFATPLVEYAGGQENLWVNTNVDPSDLTNQRVEEANYWDVQMRVKAADIQQLTPGFGFLTSMGASNASLSYGYKLLTRVGSNPYSSYGTFTSVPIATILEALTQEVSSDVTFTLGQSMTFANINTYAYIENEIVEVTALDIVLNTMTIKRGILDTVPVAHAANSIIYFSESYGGRDTTEYTESDSVNAKLLEVTNNGAFLEASATTLTLVMSNRYARPYAPGNVKIDTVSYPDAFLDDLDLTWSHRDRTQQTAYLVDQIEGNIGPEENVFYNLRIYNETNSLIHTVSNTLSTNYSYTTTQEQSDDGKINNSLRFELESINLANDTDPLVLTNYNAELGNTTGWANESGGLAVRLASPNPYEGSYYFYGGTSVLTVAASDTIDLITSGILASDIDAGTISVITDYKQSSFSSTDQGKLGVRFLDSSDSLISEVYNNLITTTSLTWIGRVDDYIIPVSTRKIKVLIYCNRVGGTNNDAYFDAIKVSTAKNLTGASLVSHQPQNITVDRAGYGLSFGQYYGGI